MQTERLRALGRRLQVAFAFARPVGPRSLPSRQALYLDAALAALVLLARLANHSGGNGLAVLVATAPLAARRRYPLAACLLLVIGVYATRHNAKPIAIATVAFAGYSAVRYSRFRGVALVSVLWLGVIVGAALLTARGR